MKEAFNEKKIKILSLNGGGIRGLFTISVLAELEQVIEDRSQSTDIRIGNYFDLITGASIGGILALALAQGRSARELKKIFFDRGSYIFPKHKIFDKKIKFVKRLISPLYKSDPLRETIVEMIGEDFKFNDLTRRVMIPTVNLSTGRPQFIKTPHNPNFTRDGRLKLIDAAMATSAAPTYFAPHYWSDLGAYFADGGLVANNPSFIGLHEVFGDMKSDFPNATHSNIHILNVGTMGEEYALSPDTLSSKRNKGYMGLWGTGEKLVHTTMTSNQFLHQYMLNRELSSKGLTENLVQLDSKIPNEAASEITLDNSSKSALDNLATRGQQLVTEEYAKNPSLRNFFLEQALPFKSLENPIKEGE